MSHAVLDTALDNLGLIEASAGTGKTWTLAGLFARAVIVERRAVPEILAVTFTIRATQELHERVRDRLLRAAELASRWREDDVVEGTDAGDALLHRLLTDALASGTESLPALRRRLDRATREMDQAAITTIHGFCQRVLAEHALDTGQVLRPAEVVTSAREMHEAVAVELWREWNSPTDTGRADDSAWLRARYGGPSVLADALSDLLAAEPLLPLPPAPLPPDPRPALDAAWQAFRHDFAQHGEAAHDLFVDALQRKVLSGVKYKPEHVASLWAWLRVAVADEATPTQWHERLDRFTRAALADGCNKNQSPPDARLCDAIAALLAAREALLPWREAKGLRCLHALRAEARERARARKQAFQQRDFDDLIDAMRAAVTDPEHGPRLCAAVRAQFPLALIDEFQDTDARQWTIFARLFGDHARLAGNAEDANGLLLVGDPKQAIYRFRGGDVHTYQDAGAIAARVPPLAENFRSRPCVIETVNALFTHAYDKAGRAGNAQPLGEGIDFVATAPGGKVADDALLIDGAPAPALMFNELPPMDSGKDWNKDEAIAHLARGCAQTIRDLLEAAQHGRVLRRDGGSMRPVEARDCAVLVRAHAEAVAVRHALAELGVPAVATGRQSVFETEQAHELLTLLMALASPSDERRLRAALATRLFGFDAARLHALADDGDMLQRWQHDFAAWRLRWEQHGPQAMLADVLARQATRLLAQVDGERQLTCFLQLGELLQEARVNATQPRGLGPQGQIDWLRAAIANADRDDYEQTPRLESDAGRVQILTLHASKGLEFPLVFLPFVALGRQRKDPDMALYQWDGQRVRQVRTDYRHHDEPAWGKADVPGSAVARHLAEEQYEDMRLLYVGLTRAREALWLWGGAASCHQESALERLLGGVRPADELEGVSDGRVRVEPARLPRRADTRRLPPQAQAITPPALEAGRKLRRDWWIHSFSQLHRQKPHGVHAAQDETPATDERPLAAIAPAVFESVDPRFRGERFGNAVHHALEHADFALWRDYAGNTPPASQREVLVAALQSQDYTPDHIEDGVRALAPLVAATLNAPLPEGARLCELPSSARVAEIEFHFTLADADSAALLDLLHAHGIARDRRDFGTWPRLSGLMNGKIDLTYVNAGRVHVLDYKSNLLADYDEATLAEAMRASEYDLQALLYVVALHRWLRVRRGAAYDYARDFGGVRYLFCRGLERESPRGIIAPRFDTALVEAVDGLLGGGGRA